MPPGLGDDYRLIVLGRQQPIGEGEALQHQSRGATIDAPDRAEGILSHEIHRPIGGAMAGRTLCDIERAGWIEGQRRGAGEIGGGRELARRAVARYQAELAIVETDREIACGGNGKCRYRRIEAVDLV